ncbi:hypothetical protein [Bradyrhizobium sp. CCBAU 43298]|uniref:hypothetical protein n=1 Tax=Bradyrhizobium TaxID=374 RepID=UPI000558FA27|nr:hypothetical protein [Bradyrhizobium sp. CCBAU 43298]
MTTEEIRKLLSRPTITPAELAESRIFPLGRNGIYDAIKRGKIATIDLGHKKAIITAPLRRQLGID